MSLQRSWIPGLEELGTAHNRASHSMEGEKGEQGRAAGKAAAAVIRSTNAKLAAVEEECRRFQRLYEDLSEGVRKYAEAHREEAETARQLDMEHRKEMQSMVTAMALLRQELERAAKDSTAVRAVAAGAAEEAKAKAEAAEKYRREYEDELARRQQLEIENIRMAREALAVSEALRALERECEALKQTVAILEEKCRLKEATFVDADKRAAKAQSELLKLRKKGLVLETQLKEQTEEKLVVQRMLELERSRKGAKDPFSLQRETKPLAAAIQRVSAAAERQKAPGNKQPPPQNPSNSSAYKPSNPSSNDLPRSEISIGRAFPTGKHPTDLPHSPTAQTASSGAKTNRGTSFPAITFSETGDNKPHPGHVTPGSIPTDTGDAAPSGDLFLNRNMQHEVEKAVHKALKSAEERCDRAVAAAEARAKQALREKELELERERKAVALDVEARLRREFAAERRRIAEAAAAEAMEAAVAAAVEEQESLHSQIDQLQATVRKFKAGVRFDSEPVRAAPISKAHVAAARKQAVLKRVARKTDGMGYRNETEGAGQANGSWHGKRNANGNLGVAGKGSLSESIAVISNGAGSRTVRASGKRSTAAIVAPSTAAHLAVDEDEPVKQSAGRSGPKEIDGLAVENERLRRALDECRAGWLGRDVSNEEPSWGVTQSDVEPWDSDVEPSGRSLRAEASDPVLGGAPIRDRSGVIRDRSASIRDGGASIRDRSEHVRHGQYSPRNARVSIRSSGVSTSDRKGWLLRTERRGELSENLDRSGARVSLLERATRRTEIRAAVRRGQSPPQKGTTWRVP